MAAADDYLMSSEPRDKNRHSMYLACSRDGGHTWQNVLEVYGDKKSGYSGLAVGKGGDAVLAWQDVKAHAGQPSNFLATIIFHGWCP